MSKEENEGSEKGSEGPVGLMLGTGNGQFSRDWDRVGNGHVQDLGNSWAFAELGTEGVFGSDPA